MSETPDNEPRLDPFQLLPIAVYRTIVADLYKDLPDPTLKHPELIADCVHAAIAQIACMVPVNAEEATTAARVVTADVQAKHCIRHARALFNDPIAAMKCHAQANHYMRTANAARSLLLRVQSARHKREAIPASCNQDAWTIHATEGSLLAANGQRVPEPPPPPQPEPDPPAPPASLDEAEHYAVLYPRRAAEIRAYGGVPPTVTYGPPDEDLVQALIASTSPIVLQIDQEHAHPVPA